MTREERPAEQEAVRTTIVGGRPPGSGKSVGPIPRGIEVLVKKASIDPDFKQLLMSERAKAADEIGLKLEPAEIAMLNAVPAAQLETIIANTEVTELSRSAFLGRAAAVMLAALGVSTQACSGPPVTGIAPDKPDQEPAPKDDEPKRPERLPAPEGIRPDRPVPKESPPKSPESKPDLDLKTRGIRPDRPKDLTPPDTPATEGIRPDRPRETEDHPKTSAGIRPDQAK